MVRNGTLVRCREGWPVVKFREAELERQAAFRAASATISARGRAPTDGVARDYDYMLALGHEQENLYPSLRGGLGVRAFFQGRGIHWWRHRDFDRRGAKGPTRNMASSQIACLNFLLPLAGTDDGLLAVLQAIDDDVTGVVAIEDSATGTSSPVEFEWIGVGHAIEGEGVTTRGEFATSIDAFLVAETARGRRAYLMELKYTETGGSEDKFREAGGETRRRIYGGPYAASEAFAEGIPLEAWSHEPFYQIMRQRLLAERMVARGELGVTDARVVVVVPEGNRAYRDRVTAPLLRRAYPGACSVEDVVRAALRHPERDFRTVCQADLAEAVKARCGSAVGRWGRYIGERYGW